MTMLTRLVMKRVRSKGQAQRSEPHESVISYNHTHSMIKRFEDGKRRFRAENQIQKLMKSKAYQRAS